MFEAREGLYYTKEHEWVAVDGENARFGMADYAQHEMGDLVYIDLPAPGTHISFGEEIGAMESVKSVEPIYAPVSGTVTEVNPALEDTPEIVNKSPYDDGWMAVIKLDDPKEIENLADYAEYSKNLS